MAEPSAVLYWDASAVLSYYFTDLNSATARKWGDADAVHLLSSLAHAECCAVIARLVREGIVDRADAQSVHDGMAHGLWRALNGLPDREIALRLSRKWRLRGADLWHLALAVSLKKELPEVGFVCFDARLREAAAGENLG